VIGAQQGSMSAPSLARRRRKSSRLGLVLAVVALLAQIAGPPVHARAPVGSANGTGVLSAAFDAHALCLAPNRAVLVPQRWLTKHPSRITTLPRAASGTAASAPFSHLLRSSSPLHSLQFVSRSRHRRPTSADIPTRLSGTAQARAPPLGA